MYAHMGMKIEEWEDGQVNIGIAVCPTKPTAISALAASSKDLRRNNMLMSNGDAGNDNFVVVPKSALIIRPPENYQSQGGVSVTYAHQPNRPSNLIVMLNPEDQGYQNMISCQEQESLSHIIKSRGIITAENMKAVERKEEDSNSSSISRSVGFKEKVEEKVSDEDKNRPESSLKEKQDSSSPDGSGESDNLKSPQDPDGGAEITRKSLERAATPEKEATGSPEKEISLTIPIKRSSDMKRVSWVEDAASIEKMYDDKGSAGKSYKESKRESVRKSNGILGNNNNRNSLTKKQHGFSSEDASNTITEGYNSTTTKGSKRSGDRSRIPLITANSAGDNPTSCEFYRRQMLRECMSYNPSSMADNWYGYTSIQKYAGEKVVKKIAAEQKRLEEDVSNRRKTEIWILGNDTDDFIFSPTAVPLLRKRTMRLKPIQIVQ